MTRGSLRTRAYKAIVPVPKSAKIHLTPEDAETVAALFLFASEQFLGNVPSGTESPWLASLVQATRDRTKRFVLRTHLVKGERLQAHLTSDYGGVLDELAADLEVPDFVWLIEVSLPEVYGDKLKLGEIAIDPSVPTNLFRKLQAYVWINLVGHAWRTGMAEPKYFGIKEPIPLLGREAAP
jgi:hypothetical protein